MTPFEQMHAFNREFSDSRDIYRQMQLWQLKNTPDDGVFCPSHQLFALSKDMQRDMWLATSAGKNVDLASSAIQHLTRKQFGLHLFGTWRNSLGIYRIDKDVFNQLMQSPIPPDAPSNIFTRLPEWCVYIELPQNQDSFSIKKDGVSVDMLGFWALLDRKPTNLGKFDLVLHLIPHIVFSNDPEYMAYMPIQMALSDGLTVEQAIKRVSDVNTDVVTMFGSTRDQDDIKKNNALLSTMLPLLLWLCAEEPDISNIKGEPISGDQLRLPKYRVNKKTGAFIPPSQPIIYNIGKRLGGEVRQFNEKVGASDSRVSSRKRPHIRRGHWHGVWSGTGQNKQFSIYWQPAIFVNAH